MAVGSAVTDAPRTTGLVSRRGPHRSPLRRRLAPYVFVLPFIVVFAAFSVYPMLFTLRLSFTNWHGAGSPQWVGWGNYTYLLTNPAFWSSLANSGVLWLLIIPVQLPRLPWPTASCSQRKSQEFWTGMTTPALMR